MATEAQLMQALREADQNGDEYAAKRFAEMIKQGRATASPMQDTPISEPSRSSSPVSSIDRAVTIDKQVKALSSREPTYTNSRIGEINKELMVLQPQGDMSKIQPLVDELQSLKKQKSETSAVKTLPETGGYGVLGKLLPDASVTDMAKITPGYMFASNDAERAQMLLNASPDIGIAEDEEGNIIAANNKTGFRAVINKPGVSAIDLWGAGGRAAAFLPAGGLQGIAAPAIGAAATETAVQGAEKIAGGSFDPQNIALEGAGAAAGGLIAGKIFNYGKLTPKQQSIVKELEVNPRDPDLAKYIVADGKPVANKALNDAIKKFGDARPIALIKAANAPDRKAVKEMVRILRKGAADPQYANDVRVGNVVGKSLAKRLASAKTMLQEAGKAVDDTVRTKLSGKRVDISDSLGAFKSALDDLRVSFDPNTGAVDFADSALEGAGGAKSRDLIKRVAKLLKGGDVSAQDAHFAKQLIDQKTAFGTSDSGISGKISNAIKGLRAQVNENLGESIPEYAKVNKKYSEVIDALNAFQDSVGSKIDLDNAAQLGLKARSLASNTQAREQMRPALENLQDVLSKYGVKFDDDVLTQSNIANFLESRFKFAVPSNSLRGEVAKAGRDVIERGATPTIIQRGIDIISATPSDKEAIDALSKILGN